jgi:hypothetical protein
MNINNLVKVTALTFVACLTAEVLTVPPSQAQGFANGCTPPYSSFYQHANNGGESTSVCLGGNTTTTNLKNVCLRKNWRGKCLENMNDSISSVYVRMTVTLYSDADFRGDCITISGDSDRVVNLSKVGFDDVTSSIRAGADRRCRVVK